MLPGLKLIEELEELRELLQGVKRTSGLLALRGENCPFYRKSARLFLEEDYEAVKGALQTCLARYQEIESDNRVSH